MKYTIHIKSSKNHALTEASEFYEKTIFVEANDCCEAVGIAMKETSIEKIDNKYLPLNITMSEKE